MPKPAPKGPGGRPTIYTDQLAEQICSRLESGESLASVCRDEAMPGIRTVLRWADEREDFAGHYQRAQYAQGEVYADKIDQIAATAIDRESALAAKVKISALQWRASKQAPRKFGDRVDHRIEHTVDLPTILQQRRQQVIAGRAALSGETENMIGGRLLLAPPMLESEAHD